MNRLLIVSLIFSALKALAMDPVSPQLNEDTRLLDTCPKSLLFTSEEENDQKKTIDDLRAFHGKISGTIVSGAGMPDTAEHVFVYSLSNLLYMHSHLDLPSLLSAILYFPLHEVSFDLATTKSISSCKSFLVNDLLGKRKDELYGKKLRSKKKNNYYYQKLSLILQKVQDEKTVKSLHDLVTFVLQNQSPTTTCTIL